jgi:hypothetical protein
MLLTGPISKIEKRVARAINDVYRYVENRSGPSDLPGGLLPRRTEISYESCRRLEWLEARRQTLL